MSATSEELIIGGGRGSDEDPDGDLDVNDVDDDEEIIDDEDVGGDDTDDDDDDDATGNVGGVSVEINVKELIADIEKAKGDGDGSAAARRRLEALLEEKRLKRLLDEDDDFGFNDLDID